jgi:hypothetical protein
MCQEHNQQEGSMAKALLVCKRSRGDDDPGLFELGLLCYKKVASTEGTPSVGGTEMAGSG